MKTQGNNMMLVQGNQQNILNIQNQIRSTENKAHITGTIAQANNMINIIGTLLKAAKIHGDLKKDFIIVIEKKIEEKHYQGIDTKIRRLRTEKNTIKKEKTRKDTKKNKIIPRIMTMIIEELINQHTREMNKLFQLIFDCLYCQA
mmetsp:Transcript_27720/g.27413  ORF Transcript_27720/g.27413 Transcript_27720/m.27413 type:complete len:145 (-) Transcript_27720:105-539(-)